MSVPLLANIRALVSGGTGGLGSAIAGALAAAGADVAVCGRDLARGSRIAAKIKQDTHRPAWPIHLDLLQSGSADRAVSEAIEQMGGLDVVVNCAGEPIDGRLESVPAEAWRRSFEVKVFGAFDLVRAALPHLKRSSAAVIVTLSGTRARQPSPTAIVAGAMNAALENGMRALAGDLARYGIRVLTVSPGPFATPRLDAIVQSQSRETGQGPQEIRESQQQGIPLKRFGEPQEIGDLITYLVSTKASFMTGSTVGIDGGV